MALKKAQIASAKKRRGTGKAKPVGNRRRRAAPAPVARRRRVAAKAAPGRKRKIARRAGAGAAIAAAAVGGALVYKNREKLIVEPVAMRRFVKAAEKDAKAKGKKLNKHQKRYIAQREKKLHARRSVDAGRIFLQVRAIAKGSPGKSLNPKSSNYFNPNAKSNAESKRYLFELYRRDVNARARARHNRMLGKKAAGFGYNSGKQVKVTKKGKVVRKTW